MRVLHINPKEMHPATGYTHIVSVEKPERIVYIAGQVAKNQKGELVGIGDLEAQTRQVYENLSSILKSMGATFADVVKQNIYTTQLDQIDIIRKVRDQYIPPNHAPASTIVGVAGLAIKELLIEIEMIAALKAVRS